MTQENELERLEGFVTKLLARFNDLQADKKKVDQLLLQREETIAILQDELAALKDERGIIGSRVSGLLDQIEAWEAGAAENEDENEDMGGNDRGSEGGVQGTLF
jgi:peptidoglycan hydrolase CwlO-like protein